MSNIISHGKRMVREDLIKKLLNGDFSVKLKDITNIQSLTDEQINELKAGDIVLKKTGDQTHAYIVTYKEEGKGICLTYADATYLETISYDFVDGNWVYNSKDSTLITSLVDTYDQLSGNKIINDFYAFDEDISISSLPTGLYCHYAHARLSNGKLNIVVAFRSESGEAISNMGSNQIGEFKLPSNVLAKLVPYISVNLSTKSGYLTASTWQASGKTILQVLKSIDGIRLNLTQEAVSTVSSTGDLRFEFNFLL